MFIFCVSHQNILSAPLISFLVENFEGTLLSLFVYYHHQLSTSSIV